MTRTAFALSLLTVVVSMSVAGGTAVGLVGATTRWQLGAAAPFAVLLGLQIANYVAAARLSTAGSSS